ncbi:hypothetical protein FEM03_11300 [Phragmitibacter flavus]|uniref:Uncharacterized protein n=1 Tax=Phragmitibacter flavus TaxID=2576071 RepID=A0A5R8KF11_9BACT|nr:hypothetical protein [Phragmitibacter flavus]TLD70884.1 hypothetical protein FEM03_11300 [Phragmitibacter flavus]
MKVQFLSASSDHRTRAGGGKHAAKKRRDEGLFWWTILITLLMGLATFCWFFSIMVFKYPEKPFNYKLLTKLEKLEEIKKFDPLFVPTGTFHGARELLAKYYNYNGEQLGLLNDLLKRSYIMNYANEGPVYVRGAYTVVNSRKLAEGDLITEGWVVRARSTEIEDVEIELLLPGANQEASPYSPGETFTLDNKATFGSVVHVSRDAETDGLCASVIPIAYGTYKAGEQQTISLIPPKVLNMESPWPLTKSEPGGTQVAAKVEL